MSQDSCIPRYDYFQHIDNSLTPSALRLLISHMKYALAIIVLHNLVHVPASAKTIQAHPPGTLIITASQFPGELPKRDIITSATTQQVGRLFNNTAVVLKSASDRMTKVQVEAGPYYRFV